MNLQCYLVYDIFAPYDYYHLASVRHHLKDTLQMDRKYLVKVTIYMRTLMHGHTQSGS